MIYNVMVRIEVYFVLMIKNKWLINLVEEKKIYINYIYINFFRYKLISNYGEEFNWDLIFDVR